MKRTTSLLAIAAALAMTASCRSRQAADIPPEALGTTPGEQTGNQDGNVSGAAVPGSRADFLQSVPSDRVLFELDSYALDGSDRQTLDAQATWLARYPNVNVTIEGHADERGTREYNLALGERRAQAARNVLIALGISPSRISTISYGKERPAVPGSTEEAYAQNRRAVTMVN